MENRTLAFVCKADGTVEPSIPVYAGVAGDDMVTTVKFNLTAIDLSVTTSGGVSNTRAARVDVSTGMGSFYASEPLDIITTDEEVSVLFPVPHNVTRAMGVSRLNLVVSELNADSVEVRTLYSATAQIVFERSTNSNASRNTYKRELSGMADYVMKQNDKIQTQVDEINYNAFDEASNPNSLINKINNDRARLTMIEDELGEIPDDKTVQGQIDDLSNGKVDKVDGKGLSTNDYTTAEKNKLAGIAAGANKTTVDSALSSTSTNPVQNKVVNSALLNKVDKVDGKRLSTVDYTPEDKIKLDGIEEGANKTTVDSALSSTSTNPVKNKVVKASIDALSGEVANKVDKVDGKGLSTNDYTTADKNKVGKIEDSQHRVPTGSTVQSQIDEINDSAFSASNPDSLTNKVGSALSGVSQLKNGKVGQKYNGGTGEIFNNYANNVASGSYSHAEGNSTTTIGVNSHAEGKSTNKATTVITDLSSSTANDDITAAWVTSSFSLAKGNASSVSGLDCLALADYSHAEGNHTTASGTQAHAEGYYTTASGTNSHAEGNGTTASGSNSHAEGNSATASGSNSHAEGMKTTAMGNYSRAGGNSTNKATSIVTGLSSDTSDSVILSLWDEQRFSLAKGMSSSVNGADCLALGDYSHAEGRYTTAIGANSNTNGYETIAKAYQFVAGKYNAARTGVSAADSQSASEALFSIGYGTSSASGNAFTVYADGTCKGVAAFEASGADYAEYFEWADGNPDGENRVGRFVTLDGDKIRIANFEDDYILGVVSGNGSFIGNAAGEEWQGKYLTDIYGTRLTQTVEIPEHTDEETGETVPAVTVTQYVLNPEYDPTVEYIPRASRKEWAAVGMLGQLTVTDDGTCTVNGYCRVSNDGTATAADSGYRVLKRLDDTHVSILYR